MTSKVAALIKLLVICIVALSFTGCSDLEAIVKAGPAKDSGFITDPSQMEAHHSAFLCFVTGTNRKAATGLNIQAL